MKNWLNILQKGLCIVCIFLCGVTGYAQEDWPHHSNDWNDELFQARVQGVYDWMGSGPDRVVLFEYLVQRETSAERIGMPVWRSSTINRDVEFFPPREAIDPDVAHFPVPKEWIDREGLIRYMSNNETIIEGYFEDKINEDAGPDTYFLMGNIYFQQAKYPEAIENYEKSIEKFSRFRLAYKNMAFAHFRLGDCDKALAAAKTAIQLGAFSSHIKGIEGYCSLQQADYQSAADAFAVARMLDRENEIWIEFQIKALIKLGMYQQAKIIVDGRIDNAAYLSRNLDYLSAIFRAERSQEDLFSVLEIKQRSGVLTEPESIELIEMKISRGVSSLISDAEIVNYLQNTKPSLQILRKILEDKVNFEGWKAASTFSSAVFDRLDFELTPLEKGDLSVFQARVEAGNDQLENALERLKPVLLNYPMHCNALLLSAEIYSKLVQSNLADTYLHRAENSTSGCRADSFGERAKIIFDRGEYARAFAMYEQDAYQKSIDGVIVNRRQANMLEALTKLAQLNSE